MTDGPVAAGVDIDHLKKWIGRETRSSGKVDGDLLRKFRATFDLPDEPAAAGIAPRLIHFCLAHPAVPTSALGADGHPEAGEFLPRVPLPRRMWAGGEIQFRGELREGDDVQRISRIVDIDLKQGRSGTLCFVQVDHQIEVNGTRVVSEIQDIVYRADQSARSAGTPSRKQPETPANAGLALNSRAVDASPQFLFRYSAITFNTHRIHYDRDYATSVEGYPGLVVHGPLQATLLIQFAEHVAGTPPARFRFRSTAPLFAGRRFHLVAREQTDGLELRALDLDGQTTMKATATWRDNDR